MSKKEIWKDIKGYEGLYQVSNLGRVKSLERKAIQKSTGHIRLVNEKIRKTHKKKNGYEFVVLSKDASLKNYSVHRLVAFSFIKNTKNYRCVNHKNGIKTDNRIENLEWCSHKQNINHSINVLKNKIKKVYVYDLNNNFINEYDSFLSASKKLNICKVGISAVIRGVQKTSSGYKFKLKKD